MSLVGGINQSVSLVCACPRQVSICGIHRDPDVWSRADEYIPERWIDDAPEAATEAQKKARSAALCYL